MTETPLKVVPLGGLGEIGQNMLALEYDGEIVVIDAGVLFLAEPTPGVDFAIPDIGYLIENRDRVRAILITHGHEDHIGALPYVVSEIDAPVYSSRLTHGLMTVKLKEHGLLRDARLNVVEPGSPFRIGKFGVEFFRVCHSIPDAMGLAITTPVGLVIHTGDFKIDHTPADGRPTDFSTLAELASEGVLLMLSDSTYAEVEGYTESERVVGEALDAVIRDAPGRIMVATFASLISRIQQVIRAAERYDRRVAVVGRSMVNNVKMALNMGYLDASDGTIVSLSQARQLPQEEVIIMATGSQGEPTSALVRIANGEHKEINVVPGDTVVVSASPIPGNETVVARTIDNLLRQGAHVLHSRIAMVHVHGHASREELKMMLGLVKPRFFVPVHGEYRHLVAHAALARDMGVEEENVFVLEDGDVLELTGDFGEVTGQVRTGQVYVDGKRLLDRHSTVLDERRRLGREGVVTVGITLDARTGEVVGTPDVASFGFMESDDLQDIFQKTSKVARSTLEQDGVAILRLDRIKVEVSDSVGRFLYRETRRRPTVLTVIEEV